MSDSETIRVIRDSWVIQKPSRVFLKIASRWTVCVWLQGTVRLKKYWLSKLAATNLALWHSCTNFKEIVSHLIEIWSRTCPCPNDMELNLSPPNPRSWANFSSAIVGSAPGERMKIRGAQLLESLKDFVRSNGGGSTKLRPSFFVTKFVTAGITWKKEWRVKCRGIKLNLFSSIYFSYFRNKE